MIRPGGEGTEFVTISFWESLAAIEAFAGADIDKAVFYPEDSRFLVTGETTVKHYQLH